MIAKSNKQSIIAKSSGEAEMLGASDQIGDGLHLKGLIEQMGTKVGPVTLMQDNQSSISLLKNGKMVSVRTKHINIRHFWLKERVDHGEIEIQYCPTVDMIADGFTKPLQEAFFRFRNEILNMKEARGKECATETGNKR